MNDFKIQTVKWSWPEPVKNKAVYRDEEFVITKTKEESLKAIDFLMSRPQSLTYTITVFRDDSYFTYFRHSMPCFGGLVKYLDSHGERYYMNPYFPRDIRVAFPEGDIIYIACYRININTIFEIPYYSFIFSEDSPWVSAFGSKDTIIFKNNYFVLTNMDADPTVFYSLMRLGQVVAYNVAPADRRHPKAEILATKSCVADPRRLAGQKPIRTSGGTWAQGYGYTRPYNESIFKTSLPTKLAKFGEVAVESGYPQAPYTPTYFFETMKSKFGIDVSKGVNLKDEKVEKALIESWDYFKEEAKSLDDKA